MPPKRIINFPSAVTLAAGDAYVIEQTGANKQVSGAQLQAFAQFFASLTDGSVPFIDGNMLSQDNTSLFFDKVTKVLTANVAPIGSDVAEYFDSEGEFKPGDFIGINPATKLVRKLQRYDHYIGIVSTKPGVKCGEPGENRCLVGLLGQLPFNQDDAVIENGCVYTKYKKFVGILLRSGDVFIR